MLDSLPLTLLIDVVDIRVFEVVVEEENLTWGAIYPNAEYARNMDMILRIVGLNARDVEIPIIMKGIIIIIIRI